MEEQFRRRYRSFGLRQPHESSRLEAINIAAARKFCTALKPSGVAFRTTSRPMESSLGCELHREDQTIAPERCGMARRVDKNYPPPRNLHKYVVRRDFPVGFADRNASSYASEIDAGGIKDDMEEEDASEPAATNEASVRKLPVKAAIFLKDQGRWINSSRQIGDIPGIVRGDSFQFRAEMSVIGLHIPYQRGIDYCEQDGIVLATSIVDNGCYNNHRTSSDILIYSGEGGKPKNGCHEPEDQRLENGNLALKNSCIYRKPVRVISYKKVLKLRKSLGRSSALNKNVYVYDGLYLVIKHWQSQGDARNIVFNFELQRISVQPKPTK